MISLRERTLYHQILPVKLAVDVTSGLLSTWLPSITISTFMLSAMDFSRQRDSAFGRYITLHMTRVAEAVRMSGQIAMWIGGWRHATWMIVIGFIVVILGWTYSFPAWRALRQRPTDKFWNQKPD
jgi:SNF family Na+-dependent transporter